MNNPTRSAVSSKQDWGSLKIAGLYLSIGGLWILFSDRLAAKFISDPALLTRISLYKGWGYVLATALLLYWLIQRHTEALRAGQEQLQLITNAFPALISYIGSDRRYRFSNQVYMKWFGHEARGKHMEEVLGLQTYRTISGYVDKVLTGETVSYEAEIPFADGATHYINATYVPNRGTNRHVKGFFALVQDVSDSKRAEEELRLWADAFEGCAHGIAISHPDTNRIVVCNPAFAGLHKCRVEDIAGKGILSLFAPSDHQHVRRSIEKADQIGHSRYEALMIRGDDSTFPVQMDIVSVRGQDGDLLHRVLTTQDITERMRTEETLRLKDELLRLTSEMAKVGGWEFDPKTGNGTWTDEVARIHDLDPKQETNIQIGLSYYEGQSREKIEQAVKEAIELGKSYDLELELVSAKGNHKWVRTMGLPIFENGKVVKVQGIFQDITERKQVEETLQRTHDELELKVRGRTAALSQANALLQALMEYVPDHIYFKDTQSRFIRNSKSQASMLGLSDPAEAVGKTDFDFFPHAQRAYEEEQEVMRSGRPLIDLEEYVVWPDGQATWVSTTKVPLRDLDGQIIGIFGISRDITERKQAEQAIQNLNLGLEKQTAQLEATNKELEAFSYSVSHDLRAPLRAIDGFTRILLEDYEPLLDEEGKRVCGIISREAQHMGQLIDDLLTFSRLGRKEMHSTQIDMKGMASSVFDELMMIDNPERIYFHVHRLPVAIGDSTLIRQVWVNLLSNAIKFSSKKERAVIEVGSKHSEEEHVYYVRDSGAGFDMEYADKLFGVFQRLHSEKEFDGTGVGLAIVQQVVRRHGGRVWAEGEVDNGATFYFALPRNKDRM